MYWVYSIIVLGIILGVIDVIYFLNKKYIEYVNTKSGQNREVKISSYPIMFLIGALIRIFLYYKDVTFLILLKETFIFGILIILIWLNVLVFKNWFFRTKSGFKNLKNIEKQDGQKLFEKDDNNT